MKHVATALLVVVSFWMPGPVAAVLMDFRTGAPILLPAQNLSPKLKDAVEALRRGEADVGLAAAREFLREQPGSAAGHETLGAAFMLKRQWNEARQAFNQALRIEPRRPSTLLQLSQVALETGDPKQAESYARQTISLAPQATAAHRMLAIALLRQGRAQNAIEALSGSLKLSQGQDLDLKYLLAAIYQEVGRPVEAERLLADVLLKQPDSGPALLLQGLVKLELGKTDEAAQMLRRTADRDPGSLWARMGLALVQRSKGESARARTELEKIAKERPDWTVAHSQLGAALLAEGKIDAALAAFERAEATSTAPAAARLRTAQLLLAGGHTDRAVAKARAAMAMPALAAEARMLLVRAYLIKGAPELAERELLAAVAAAPQDTAPAMQLGGFYLSLSRPKDALVQFDRAAQLNPVAPEPARGQAEAYLALGQSKAAVAASERLVKALRETPEAYVFLGSVQEGVQRPADALRSYQKALERDRHHIGATRALAALYEKERRMQEAVKLLQDAAAARPEALIFLVDIAQMQERAGNRDATIAAYRQVLQREPGNTLVLNNLAYVLGRDARSLDEALGMAERAYKQARGSPAVSDTLGWLLYQKGETSRAAKLIEDAAKAAPKEPQIQYHLAAIYARQGRKADARRLLEEVLQGSAFRDAGDARKLMESLR